MNLTNIFSLTYWLELPQTDFLLGFPLLIIALVTLFTPSICKKIAVKNKVLKKSFKKKLIWFYPLGGLMVFFIVARFGEIGFLSYRFLLGVTLLGILSYYAFFTYKVLKEVSRRKASIKREKQKRAA